MKTPSYSALPWVLLLSAALLAGSAVRAAQPGVSSSVQADAGAAGAGVVPVRPGIYMLTADGVNVVLQTGTDGAIVVDTGPTGASGALIAQIRKVTSQPIRFLIDTSADPQLIGGNAAVAAAGQSLAKTDTFVALDVNGFSGRVSFPGSGASADVIARQKVLEQMLSTPSANYASAALPSDTFTRQVFHFFLNDSPIAVVALPAGHSDADSAVRFERPDVVVTGAVFDQTRFPVIDLQHGGSIQGEIDALDQIANTLAYAHVPVLANRGATLIIPVRGPVSDMDDLITYRDMVATVRDRIEYYIGQGKTLQQIRAANPAEGYTTRYGADTGSWTTTDFINAVYSSLMAQRKAHQRGRRG